MASETSTEKAVTKAASILPYKLDDDKTLKACRALLKYISTKKSKSNASKPNLLEHSDDPSDAAEAIWLIVTTKKYITDRKKLKPTRIAVTHPFQTPTNTTACLIVKDPQRHFKDLVAAASLTNTVTRVIGVSKLGKKFKMFEQRRQLRDSHDIFLADDRVVTMLPHLLGKSFYKKASKTPIPVHIAENVTPEKLAGEVNKAFGSTYLHLSAAASTNIRVGLSSFTPEQLAENTKRVLQSLIERKIPGGWKSVKSVYIKSHDSASLPIWMTTELYEEADIMKPAEEEERKKMLEEKDKKRKERQAAKKAKKKSLSDGKEKKAPVAKRLKVSEEKAVEVVESFESDAVKPEEKKDAPKESVPEEVPRSSKNNSTKRKASESASEPTASKSEKPKKRKMAAETVPPASKPIKEEEAAVTLEGKDRATPEKEEVKVLEGPVSKKASKKEKKGEREKGKEKGKKGKKGKKEKI